MNTSGVPSQTIAHLNASKKYLRYNAGVVECGPSFLKGPMATPLTLPPLSTTHVTELRPLYDTTTNATLRLRAQMVLLAHQGRSVADIATMIFRSRATVARVLKRFLQGGIAALPPLPPSRPPAHRARRPRIRSTTGALHASSPPHTLWSSPPGPHGGIGGCIPLRSAFYHG